MLEKETTELFGHSLAEVKELMPQVGLAPFRAKQIFDWLYSKNVWQFAEMTNFSPQDAELLAANFTVLPARIKIVKEQVSQDGLAHKFLLELADKKTIECVGMKHDYGKSICISSQVGCAIGCQFCASTLNGFTRNLSAAEMLAQFAFFKKYFGKIKSVVLMGSGEPLLNYAEVVKFIRLVHEQDIYGLSYRSITLSTCGLVPQIKQLSEENLPISLAISLHAPVNELRSRLMPINKKYPVQEVVAAAAEYAQKTGRRIMYEYLLIEGVNDSELCAKELANLLKGELCFLNLIPVNSVLEKNWRRPAQEKIDKFFNLLKQSGLAVTVRREMGSDIMAACGQLKAQPSKLS